MEEIEIREKDSVHDLEIEEIGQIRWLFISIVFHDLSKVQTSSILSKIEKDSLNSDNFADFIQWMINRGIKFELSFNPPEDNIFMKLRAYYSFLKLRVRFRKLLALGRAN